MQAANVFEAVHPQRSKGKAVFFLITGSQWNRYVDTPEHTVMTDAYKAHPEDLQASPVSSILKSQSFMALY